MCFLKFIIIDLFIQKAKKKKIKTKLTSSKLPLIKRKFIYCDVGARYYGRFEIEKSVSMEASSVDRFYCCIKKCGKNKKRVIYVSGQALEPPMIAV